MIDDVYLAQLLTQNNDILLSIYGLLLFVVGVTSAIFVLYILYKFIKLFY